MYPPRIAKRRLRRMRGRARQLVPTGMYCYRAIRVDTLPDGMPVLRTRLCPFWSQDPRAPADMNGYCRLMMHGDNSPSAGFTLLFDQVKECGINQGNLEDIIAEQDDIREAFAQALAA